MTTTLHDWSARIVRDEAADGRRRVSERRRFNAAVRVATSRRRSALPSCRHVHPDYSKSNRKPAGAAASRLPARCIRTRDNKEFALPRRYSRKQCDAWRRQGKTHGFTARASCAAFH